MASNDISENVRHLVFEMIDSVEQLEVLLLLRLHRDRQWSSTSVNAEIRSNPQSVLNRLILLEQLGFLERPEAGQDLFQYKPRTDALENTVSELADAYKVRPQKIFELIFSPLKKGRHFAAAFKIDAFRSDASTTAKPKKGTDKGNDDG